MALFNTYISKLKTVRQSGRPLKYIWTRYLVSTDRFMAIIDSLSRNIENNIWNVFDSLRYAKNCLYVSKINNTWGVYKPDIDNKKELE